MLAPSSALGRRRRSRCRYCECMNASDVVWMPEPHRSFLERVLSVLRSDRRVVGVAAAGSFIGHRMDVHSDLDLALVVEEEELTTNRDLRTAIAAGLGRLAASFTGEPRLLI